MKTDEEILQTELYAWVGEDEHGSGIIGLKQAQVPAGYIPLVTIARDRHKIARDTVRNQMEMQASVFGKKIRLVRFQAVAIEEATKDGS